jgi:ubiquilin
MSSSDAPAEPASTSSAATASLDEGLEIHIKAPSDTRLTLKISPDKTVLELKELIATQPQYSADDNKCPPDTQRLIYSGEQGSDLLLYLRPAFLRGGGWLSLGCFVDWRRRADVGGNLLAIFCSGRILKDEDVLSTYKIVSGNTIHLVRGKPRPAAPPPAAQVPEQLSAGQQIAGNPLAPLLNAQNAGVLGAMGNPFAQMGINTNDPNMVSSLSSVWGIELGCSRGRHTGYEYDAKPSSSAANG